MRAFFDVRDWLLDDPDFATAIGWTGTGYKPFWPVQEAPESKFPYIRYNLRLHNNAEEWWMESEEAIMAIYADISTATNLFNIIRAKVNRGSESARPLTVWQDANGRGGYKFHSLEYLAGGDYGVTTEEGGVNPAFVHIRYRYSL